MSLFYTTINYILNIIFPAKCMSCGNVGLDLCLKCLSDSPSAERETEKWIYPLYDYRHPPIKKAILFLKYKGKRRLASIFALVMYDKILEELSELSIMENFNKPILMPIPLSPKRMRERGYNQSELICRELIKIDHLRLSAQAGHSVDLKFNFNLEKKILVKIKNTEHQARIESRRKRLENLIGSFAIKNKQNTKEIESKIKNRNIILIDDVTTTGATLNEAKKILKQAGVRKVIAFTVAH